MPAAKAQTVAAATEVTVLRALTAPANTAIATTMLARSIRQPRWAYGSELSEKATFNAPTLIVTPPEMAPVAAPTASGIAIPRAFRSAIHGVTLSA